MRPGDIPSACIAPAFRQVVRLGASWSVLFTCPCSCTPQLLAASALRCSSLSFVSAHMDELQNMRLPLGTTGWNHSYYTGIPHSALHSLQQFQAGSSSPSPVQKSASTWESHSAATSSSVSCPQVTHSAISPQVQTGPNRTVTSDLVSAMLAEAATQLSFAALLERCISVSASPPPPLPIPTPLLDAATQTIPHIAVSQDVSTQLSLEEFSPRCVHPHNSSGALAPPSSHDVLCPTCSRPVPSLLLDAAVQTPLYCVASHDASTQLPLTEFFMGCIFSNDPFDRQGSSSARYNAGHASPPQPADIAALCSPSSTSHTSDGHEDTTAPRVLPQPPRGLEKYARQCASHGIPVNAAPVRPHLCTSISVAPPQPHVSTTQVGTHPLRSATSHKRNACTALAGTHNPVGADPRAGTGPVPKPRALVLPMIKFGQSKPDGLGHIDIADSDLMHHQYRLSVLQWNPGLVRRNPTNIIAAACGSFHAVILQETSDHVPHISDQFIAQSGNTDLAILLNKDTFDLNPTVLDFRENSTSKGTWGMVLLIVRALSRRPSLSGTPTVTFCSVHIYNVVAKKRDASTEPVQRLHGYMRQHNVDFIGSDFNMSALSTVGDVF